MLNSGRLVVQLRAWNRTRKTHFSASASYRFALQSITGSSDHSSWSSRCRSITAIASAIAAVATTSSFRNDSLQCDNSGQDHDRLVLRDGRCLAFRVHGKGVPVIALHGMESSRHTYDTMQWGTPPETVEKLFPGVQVVAVDRPGYGDSSSPPYGYSYKDFVDDLVELADTLNLRRFCIAGHSSGGPYALAAAALLPERVVACAAISSDGPYAHRNATPSFAQSGAMPADALVRSGVYGDRKSKQHAWRQGPLGWVCDYVLERIEWPFTVESIALGPRLTIWYGSEDVDAIIQGGQFLHTLIPGSQLREQPRRHGFKKDLDGNCNFGYLREIFEELKQHWETRVSKL